MVISLKEKELDENNLLEIINRMKINKHKRIYLVDVNEKDLQSIVNIVIRSGNTINNSLFSDKEYIIELR
jgi:hypothetical protein